MSPDRIKKLLAVFILATLAFEADCIAQEALTAPDGGTPIETRIDSSFLHNDGSRQIQTVFQSHVHDPGAAWIRLKFEDVQLAGEIGSGTESVLRLTSLLDGAVQELNALALIQWQNASAYFNGDTVLIEIISHGASGIDSFRMSEFVAGPQAGVPAEVQRTICGATDDRVLSDDPRVARLAPIGCTTWIIDDCNHCFLTAGHCTSNATVVQFNVPLSNPNGSWNHPHPDDQYPVDPSSMQSNGGQGIGNDWAYFGAFPNSNTGLRPVDAQGGFFVLTPPPAATGQPVRVTGYGTVTAPVPGTWNQVQKTHVGPFTIRSGNRIAYAADTTGGNSGSPVIIEFTGVAIGIHTHAGCSSSGGSNNGTSSLHPALQEALANPLGVCCEQVPEPLGPFALLNPADGSEQIQLNPVLQWESSNNAQHYRVWLADNSQFNNPAINGFTTANTQISLPPYFLKEETTYYWYVLAIRSDGESLLSTPGVAAFSTVVPESPCPGDADSNGVIDLNDLSIVLVNFGSTSAEGPSSGDVTGDGVVDLNDLNLVLSRFGQTCP